MTKLPYKDKARQNQAMQKIMRDFRKREKERQINIEQTIKKLDEKAWQQLYEQKRRRK